MLSAQHCGTYSWITVTEAFAAEIAAAIEPRIGGVDLFPDEEDPLGYAAAMASGEAPEYFTIVGNKWVFVRKRDGTGQVIRFKGRQ